MGLAVGRGHPLADEISRYKRRPVDAKRTFGRRRSGGVKAGVAAERELHRGVGERPADAVRIAVFHGDAQLRRGLLVGGRVIAVITQQAHVDLVEPIAPAEQVEQLLLGPSRLLDDVEAGEDQGHGVPVTAQVVDPDLQRRRRRGSARSTDRNPIRTQLGQLHRVEMRHHVGI